MNLIIPVTIENIYSIIKEQAFDHTTSILFEELANNPINILLSHEIYKYTNEELENVQNTIGQPFALLHAVYDSENSFLFSVLIEKGAFLKQLSPHSKELLDTNKHTETLYQQIFTYEKNIIQTKDNHYENLIESMYSFLLSGPPNQRAEEVNNFIDRQPVEIHPYIHSFVMKNFGYDSLTTAMTLIFINSMKEKQIDLNATWNLNTFLPVEKYKSNRIDQDPFFLSKIVTGKVGKLMGLGYRFHEKNYRHHHDNLCTALIRSGNVDTTIALLPYLTHLHPANITMEQQQELIENINTHEKYKDLKSLYSYCLINQSVTLDQQKAQITYTSKQKL